VGDKIYVRRIIKDAIDTETNLSVLVLITSQGTDIGLFHDGTICIRRTTLLVDRFESTTSMYTMDISM